MATADPISLLRNVLSLARAVDVMLGAGGIQNARDAVARAALSRRAREALDGSVTEFMDVHEEVQVPETLAH